MDELDPAREWLSRRTSHESDWPLPSLLGLKADSGTTVSVVLPALNEQHTVGPIVAAIVADLGRPGLVDEVVVVDSGSTDRTAAVAAAAGARVVRREDVLSCAPPLPGKGEVLWRSLAATEGELICFVDADLEQFSSAVVRGVLGPLLADPGILLVKAAYERPLADGTTVHPAGGGRVTELVARPLLNLYWPQLAGFVQPLGGEYAGRRALLESLPFPSGYGVEFALLVDTYAAHGLDALAQVDAGVRHHRHQDEQALGRMAAEILQVAQARLGGPPPVSTRLTQFARTPAGFAPVTRETAAPERPPLNSVALAWTGHADADGH
ncbi:glucosyl-3-phosphoglycerate synthase [Actinocrinis puniceicyclus]|uniref:Glucosyl-3-phosphoglycerate synthase n=1 Tax=Actinocrinis puniceicyclus TaxID=977794 RepID=A0A8J8BCX9_9ACTN|nr:glucosyl-3-phosphoglycerate synthase [Actinocrinis puniceicyclus]MBS2965602.1 glucosyl-3-phosphoglycerate synthase [Actinocrinis puniceicyclus]